MILMGIFGLKRTLGPRFGTVIILRLKGTLPYMNKTWDADTRK